jgi:hypothetical protein
LFAATLSATECVQARRNLIPPNAGTGPLRTALIASDCRTTLPSVSEWFKKPTHQAGLLVAVGFVATALIAVLGDHAEWPVLLLLTLLAGVFQAAGAVLLNKTGSRPVARASVREAPTGDRYRQITGF